MLIGKEQFGLQVVYVDAQRQTKDIFVLYRLREKPV